MDDVDAVQAQIARNMLESGDWVTARLNGVAYLEKSPLKYWMMACSFAVFGVHDWAARLPVVLSILALCVLVAAIGRWAFSRQAGFYSGLVLSTCIGLFLFTRILIPDVILTLTIALALWALLRALDEAEPRPRLWAALMAAAMGVGLLLKGLIAVLFPVAAGLLFLLFTGRLLSLETWKRLRPFSGTAIILLIAAPWHIARHARQSALPRLLHALRPRQVPRLLLVLLLQRAHPPLPQSPLAARLQHRPALPLLALPPALVLPLEPSTSSRLAKLQYRGSDRAAPSPAPLPLLAGFILVFFTFSTTQEYYSLPAYPAFALLLGSAMAEGSRSIRIAQRISGTVAALACAAIVFILSQVWNLPAPGDISQALTQNPDMYTLSLGHMGDLTLKSFAYLKTPLALAALAFLIGAIAAWRYSGYRAQIGLAIMMVLFFHAARIAMIAFDPYLSSQPLAAALKAAPPGRVVFDNQYYTFSSVFFYANVKHGLLLNGRVNNLEYGSYAPGAPPVFIDDGQFTTLLARARPHLPPRRAALLAEAPIPRTWCDMAYRSSSRR